MNVLQIAEFLGGKLIGQGETEISGAAALQAAQTGDISFLEKYDGLIETGASCLIIPESSEADIASALLERTSYILDKNPKLAFARIAAKLHPPRRREANIHQSAVISETAKIGKELFIGPHVCIGDRSEIGDRTQILAGAQIGDDVQIGKNCTIHPNVFIESGNIIGSNVILHPGVSIGADGFGYVRDGAAGYIKFPQIGRVVIEDDVEIGANTCIDRGALGETHIGQGTKIDNLVQIAHNVQIGKRVIIAAQTGISGSTVLEDDCVIGGQVGMGDHARVLTGAIIGSQAGVLPGKIVRAGVWWGTPVQPLDEYKRQNAMVKGLSRLKEQVKELSRRLGNLSEK